MIASIRKTGHHPGSQRARKLDHIIAIDGEGYSVQEGGEHRYVMLCASNGTKIENVSGLSTIQCFEFLTNLPVDALKIAFSFGYDINMMLGDLPLHKLRELTSDKGWCNWRGYHLTWQPSKMFTISSHRKWRMRKNRNSPREMVRKVCYDKSCTIWDVFGYFQHSFQFSLVEWDIGTVEVQNEIIRMKERRSQFSDAERASMAAYCFSECELLVQMFHKLLAQIDNLGLKLCRYDGAGSVASAMLRKHRITQYIEVPPEKVHHAALHGYFGGRFETGVIGYVGEAHSYDINSAYPAITAELPCLRCGRWRMSTNLHQHGIYHIKWNINGRTKLKRWGPFPYRTGAGGIVYPHAGEGWYWGAEIIAAKHVYADSITVIEGYRYATKCSHKPYSFVPEYYKKRQKLKEVGDFAHIVLKLGLNSLYGKCAQSIGGKRNADGTFQRPTYQSFIWAGMITSGTRAKILYAIARDPENVLSIATDGIFTKTEIPSLPIGTGLGQWEHKEIHDLSLVQNGVYRYRVGEIWHQRARGFPGRDFDFDRLLVSLDREGENAQVSTHALLDVECLTCKRRNQPCATPRFVGARAGLQRNPPLLQWRRWIRMPKTITLKPPNRLLESYVGGDRSIRPIPTFAWLEMRDISTAYKPHANFTDLFRHDEDAWESETSY